MKFLLLLVLFCGCSATNYYVSNVDGSDTNDGLSLLSALKTITAAVSAASQPGDNVLIRAGIYVTGGGGTISMRYSGNTTAPITVKGVWVAHGIGLYAHNGTYM